MAKCAICEKGAHFGNNVSHSHRRSPKMWKSNVKSVRVKTEGGGIGGKITPSAVIVIQDGKTKLVNIKNQDTITKLLDMVPDVVDRFTSKDEKLTEEDVADILDAE